MKFRWLAPLFLWLICGSCGTQRVARTWEPAGIPPAPKQMREEQVVALADKVATERGILLSEFKPPQLSFDQRDHRWNVFYLKKQQKFPGDHFGVFVDDTTGSATFMGGR